MEIGMLHTEQRNPATVGITEMTDREMLEAISRENENAALAVNATIPQIERALALIVPRMKAGGRMVYMGAGTSGRLGMMDAAECRPTYGVAEGRVTFLIAGGLEAIYSARENAEDSAEAGRQDLIDFGLTDRDVLVAAAASGRTPYCICGLDYAREIGAGTVSISCNPDAILSSHAEVGIEADTGPEVIMGSTRMKAGTAQKMIMNMLSTCAMIRLGRTYDNLMICVASKNEKLNNRMIRQFQEATGLSAEEARCSLEQTGGRLDAAVLHSLSGQDVETVFQTLQSTENFGEALKKLR